MCRSLGSDVFSPSAFFDSCNVHTITFYCNGICKFAVVSFENMLLMSMLYCGGIVLGWCIVLVLCKRETFYGHGSVVRTKKDA